MRFNAKVKKIAHRKSNPNVSIGMIMYKLEFF